MARGVSVLDVSSPLLTATTGYQLTNHNMQPPSSLSSSSSTSSLTIMIIVISSALILSASLYLLLRCLSCNPSCSSTVASRTSSSSSSADVPQHNSCHCKILATDDSIQSLPLFEFSSLSRDTKTADCTICLANFEPTDQLRLLPLCCHAFHADCIDKWLSSSHDTCPLCRSAVYPTEDDVLNKTPPSLNRGNSYRIEIGTLSRCHAKVRESEEGTQRSYSVGPFEYLIEDGYEVSVGFDLDKQVLAEASANLVGVEENANGIDMAGWNWLMDYVDQLGSFSLKPFSRQSSGRCWNGSVRQSQGVATVEDLETNRIGENITEFFQWLSGV